MSRTAFRWQNHWHRIPRQSWAFFQNDFAGTHRDAASCRLGPAIRESLGVAADLRSGSSDLRHIVADPCSPPPTAGWRLPVLLWFAGYIVMLRVLSSAHAEQVEGDVGSALDADRGALSDTYTNIVTVKLFRARQGEDGYVREAIDYHTDRFHESLRLNTLFALTLTILNSLLIVAMTGAFAIVLWRHWLLSASAPSPWPCR
jgi:ATP-binding cassette subfamily B multidrug efflux pump